ncbi:hypothetical protein CEXT_766111 [Caerostris extrusa]|uniref:Uncharacterized protein n=1 Tax=Caerostris extrusa TaxID=172846 RepID=A0AAV4W1W2_CAEEX|nr:hypothetical protein CEXT_766111 [Caerostris extrusa]
MEAKSYLIKIMDSEGETMSSLPGPNNFNGASIGTGWIPMVHHLFCPCGTDNRGTKTSLPRSWEKVEREEKNGEERIIINFPPLPLGLVANGEKLAP